MAWAIWDGLAQQFDPTQNCLFAHNVAALASPVAISFIIPGVAGTVIGPFIKPILQIQKLADRLDIVGIVGSKVTSLAFKTGFRAGKGIKKEVEFLIRNSDGKLSRVVGDLDENLGGKLLHDPDGIVHYDNQPVVSMDHTLYHLFEKINDLFSRLTKSDAVFRPEIYRDLDEVFSAYLQKNKQITLSEVLDDIPY